MGEQANATDLNLLVRFLTIGILTAMTVYLLRKNVSCTGKRRLKKIKSVIQVSQMASSSNAIAPSRKQHEIGPDDTEVAVKHGQKKLTYDLEATLLLSTANGCPSRAHGIRSYMTPNTLCDQQLDGPSEPNLQLTWLPGN